MSSLRRQEFTLHLESELGTLYETTLTMSSNSKRVMPTEGQLGKMAKTIYDYCLSASGIKLIGLAVNKSVVVDLVEPK